VKRFVSGQENVDGDLEPCAFWTLTRMIESGQFGRLKRGAFDSWIRNEGHQPDSFDAARVLAWQAVEGALNLFLSALRQSTLVLVFDTYCHKKSVTVGEGRESGQVRSKLGRHFGVRRPGAALVSIDAFDNKAAPGRRTPKGASICHGAFAGATDEGSVFGEDAGRVIWRRCAPVLAPSCEFVVRNVQLQ